jgi:hypothetical protein
MLDRPMIVCEGPTDNSYLRIALQRLAATYPQMIAVTPTGFQSRVSYFKHSDLADEVLKLGGGIGGQKILAMDYARRITHFRHRPLKHPVILLVDNDVPKVLNDIATAHKVSITLKASAPFYHLGYNLYLVKTPEASTAGGSSCIENLFHPSVLSTVIDGKTFKAKDSNPLLHYGKVALIEKVIQPNASVIDFSGFNGLLSRIAAVIAHYHAP